MQEEFECSFVLFLFCLVTFCCFCFSRVCLVLSEANVLGNEEFFFFNPENF